MGNTKEDALQNSIQAYVDRQMETYYSKKTIALSNNPVNMGRIKDASGSAIVKGVCGDTMEVFLQIDADMIKKIHFFADGCGGSVACGSAMTQLVQNKSLNEALQLSANFLIREMGGLPRDDIHCAILSVSTLYKAIAEYLLKSESIA